MIDSAVIFNAGIDLEGRSMNMLTPEKLNMVFDLQAWMERARDEKLPESMLAFLESFSFRIHVRNFKSWRSLGRSMKVYSNRPSYSILMSASSFLGEEIGRHYAGFHQGFQARTKARVEPKVPPSRLPNLRHILLGEIGADVAKDLTPQEHHAIATTLAVDLLDLNDSNNSETLGRVRVAQAHENVFAFLAERVSPEIILAYIDRLVRFEIAKPTLACPAYVSYKKVKGFIVRLP